MTELNFNSGFHQPVTNVVTESLLQKLKGHAASAKTHLKAMKRVKPAVDHYMNRASHNLKKVSTKHGIPVGFSAPSKLAQIWPCITCSGQRDRKEVHTDLFRSCAEGVVYEITLSCGKSHTGINGTLLK